MAGRDLWALSLRRSALSTVLLYFGIFVLSFLFAGRWNLLCVVLILFSSLARLLTGLA
jgi:hypothetical protein